MQENNNRNININDLYFQEIIKWIKLNKPSKDELAKKKVKLCKELSLKKIPTDIEIFLNAKSCDINKIKKYVETKPTRTGSGVAVVATMTKPSDCPHGSCIYCPGGVNSEFGDIPKSYTGKEPSTMRGIRNNFDPYLIIFNRLEQYIVLGQNPEKVDQVIMGGTFPATNKRYQKNYIYYSFKAYNDFSKLFYFKKFNTNNKNKNGNKTINDNRISKKNTYNNEFSNIENKKSDFTWELNIDKFKEFFELPGNINDKNRIIRIKKKIISLKKLNLKTLEKEHKINEDSAIKCIGITVETRPDYGRIKHGLELLELGVTRIELGIQTVDDNILKYVNRGHTLDESIKSISELRDLGFKLNFHIMPGLPDITGKRISAKKDIQNFKTLFDNENFKPDMLKIYPCMVMPGTKLFKDYNDGIFKPLSTLEAAEIITEGFRYIPEWCRVMRVQRDIPTYVTTSGVDKTNLRQYIEKIAKELNIEFKDIRSREIKQENIVGEPKIIVREYFANGGKEFFISSEGKDHKGNIKLLGFLRLRILPRTLHPAMNNKSSIIRELHVYGSSVGVGKENKEKTQHKGIGKYLVAKAEEISIKNNIEKVLIISGVGVRGYYKKLGYKKEGPYMAKKLNKVRKR
jgi:elongator complex protein 3